MATLTDEYALAHDYFFKQRIQEAIITQAIAVAAESTSTTNHPARLTLAGQVLINPVYWTDLMAQGIVTNATVGTTAGSPPVQSNVSDTLISNVVITLWDAYSIAP